MPFDVFQWTAEQNLTHAGTASLGPALGLTYVKDNEMARVVQALSWYPKVSSTYFADGENIAIL